MDKDNHGVDTWKKPNHPTFSNQSKYHGVDGFYGGNWNPDGGYQPSKQTASMYGPSYYDRMFAEEPGRIEHLDASRYRSGANKPSPLYFAMGGSIPGSVGFTYARTGSTPSEGPYAKKTLPSAQTGYSSKPFEMVWKENAPSKKSTNNVERYEPSNAVKNAKSTLAVASLAGSSNPVTQYLAQIAGGTGDLYTSARYAMDKNWGKAGEDFVQGALGFIPYSKAIQGMKGDYFTKGAQFFNKWLKRAHAASDVKTLSESPKNTKLPRHENGGSMSFYQHGLDWTPRNISENGSEIPMAQEGKNVPWWMKKQSDISQRGNQNIKTEIATQKTKQKKAEAAKNRYTIGEDKRTSAQKEKDKQEFERRKKVEEEWYGKDFNTPQYIQDKNRARAEHLIHLADVGSMGAGLITGAGELAAKQLPKVGEYLTTQTPLKNAYKYNPWAFKANPEAGYRMIGGKEGYLDAITSGQIRPTGAYEHAHFNIGQPLNPNRLSAEELIQAGSPGGYKGPYMAEMQQGTWQRMSDAFPNNPEMQEQFRLLGKDKDVWQHPLFGNIKVDDTRLKLYKEDWLRGYKEVPKKEKGGVVKDNMGYWNPDNWGKVVEIDSPNITMQGVNQDLIGISDEGDVQYMEPGKDYKFKGKKVKEYPVAKYGVNQQDEKTAQHLDQLLNFTNYNKPTKGGWLDKY